MRGLDREALELERREPLVQFDGLAGIRESIDLQNASIAPRPARASRTGSTRRRSSLWSGSMPPSSPAMNWNGLIRDLRSACWSGWSQLGVIRRVERHVGERRAAVDRVAGQRGRSTTVLLAIRVRAAEIDDVRSAGRRVRRVVVPALRGAVADILRRGHVGEDSRAGSVVRATNRARLAPASVVSVADVHPGVAARKRVRSRTRRGRRCLPGSEPA